MFKLLIIGETGHGKDTFAEFVREFTGAKFISSVYFATRKIIYPVLQPLYNYQSLEECYEDRINHHEVWYKLIRDFNTPNKTALATALLQDYDICVGMRSADELKACKAANLFDAIVLVDASERLDCRESAAVRTEMASVADTVINNNGSQASLREDVVRFICDLETWVEYRHEAEVQREACEAELRFKIEEEIRAEIRAEQHLLTVTLS